jgi:4-amino-4-deoxy-L-arabinose transferase-like glycosyltransferase
VFGRKTASPVAAPPDPAEDEPAGTASGPEWRGREDGETGDLVTDHGLLLEPRAARVPGRVERAIPGLRQQADRLTSLLSSWPVILGGLSSTIAAVALGANLFGFPASDDTEGATLLQASSFLHGGGAHNLAGYAHVPGAPLLLAAWDLLLRATGNVFGAFDGLTSIESGRVLMVVLGCATAALVFVALRRLTGYDLLATGGALLFALSPLETWYGRTLHPQGFAAFWLAAAVALALPPARGLGQLYRPVLAGLALGLAITSMELTVVAVPGFALIVAAWPRERRRLVVSGTILGTVAAPAALVLWLIANHAFFASPGHPSFVSALASSAGQQGNGGLGSSGQFAHVKDTWSVLAPFLVIACALLSVWLTVAGRGLVRRGVGLIALSFWALFASGVAVQDYFAALALPVWVSCVVMGFVDLAERGVVQRRLWGFGPLARVWGATIAIGLLLLGPSIPSDAQAFSSQDAAIQSDMTVWLREHVPVHAAVVDNGSDRLDLTGTGLGGRSLDAVCTYYDVRCVAQAGVTVAYVVDTSELRYLAHLGYGRAASLRQLALTGELVWSAEGLSDGDFIHVLRVSIPDTFRASLIS